MKRESGPKRLKRLKWERQEVVNDFAAGKIRSVEAIRLRRMYDDLISEAERHHRKAVKQFQISSRSWRKKVGHEV